MTTKKLIEVLKAVPASLKAEGRNDYLKYGYLTLDQLKTIFHKVFAEKGIVFLFETENVDVKEAGEGFLTTASFVVRLLDEEGEVRIHTFGQAFDKEGKGLAKAKTDALKRFFTDSFLIAVGEEDEDTTYGKTEADTQQNTQPPKSDTKVIKRVFDPIYGEEKATDPQIKKIFALAQQLGISKEDLEKEVKSITRENGVGVDQLSKSEASELIQKLMSKKT
jgi:hypothetical protein